MPRLPRFLSLAVLGLMLPLFALGVYSARAQTVVEICPPSLFDALDSNGDDSISLEEYSRLIHDKKAANGNFAALDLDHDGFLRSKDAKALFGKLDKNRDKQLDRAELSQRWSSPAFRGNQSKSNEDMEILDFNRDGVVVFDEFSRNWPGMAMVSW